MKLLLIHGPPGVGKFTVANHLVEITGFRLFHYHALGRLFGPLVGYESPAFAELRDRFYAEVLREAAAREVSAIVSTFWFEPTVRLDWLDELWREVQTDVFAVGLSCDVDELRLRIETRDRGSLGGIGDFRVLEQRGLLESAFDFPNLPCPGIVIDTTSLGVEAVVAAILDALPDSWQLQ